MRITIFILLLVCALVTPSYVFAQNGVCNTAADVAELPIRHWCEVPNSKMRSVEKKPSEFSDWNGGSSQQYNSFQRVVGVESVPDAWNSAAFDTNRNCLLLTGGGHNDYGGNEVYKFCLNNLQWSRVTDPTPFPSRHPQFQNSDGTPISRHTYGGLAYLPGPDRFFVFDGSPDSASGGCGTVGTWTLDLAARDSSGSYSPSQWELRTTSNEPTHACGNAAAYDPISRNVILKSPFATHTYNFDSNRWSQVANSGRPNDYISLAVDPQQRILVEAGSGVTALWSIDNGYSGGAVSTSGANNVESTNNPGLAYDSSSRQIVGWVGGTTVYTLNSTNRSWTAVPPATTNSANPGPVTTAGGAFARFNYSPASNVFMYVDSVDGNVFLYRLADGEPLVSPNPPTDLQSDEQASLVTSPLRSF